MVRSRKKIVVFLIPVMLGCGVIMVCSTQSSADAEKPVSNSGGTELEKSQSESNSLFENDSNFLSFRVIWPVPFLLEVLIFKDQDSMLTCYRKDKTGVRSY